MLKTYIGGGEAESLTESLEVFEHIRLNQAQNFETFQPSDV